MNIDFVLDVALVIGVLCTLWHSVMLYRETAIGRWYRADHRAKREQQKGRAMVVEPQPELGGLSESQRVRLRVEAYLASPLPCVNGQPEDANHRIVRVRDRSPD